MKHYINKFGEVDIHKNNDTRLRREPTDYELELLEEIKDLENKLEDAEVELEVFDQTIGKMCFRCSGANFKTCDKNWWDCVINGKKDGEKT